MCLLRPGTQADDPSLRAGVRFAHPALRDRSSACRGCAPGPRFVGASRLRSEGFHAFNCVFIFFIFTQK